jgi:hypothetical protein
MPDRLFFMLRSIGHGAQKPQANAFGVKFIGRVAAAD